MAAGVENNSLTQCDVSDVKRQQLWQAVESTAEKLTESEQEQLYYVLLYLQMTQVIWERQINCNAALILEMHYQ